MRIGRMAWSELRLPVPLVVDIWDMFSRAKGFLHPVRSVVFVLFHWLMSDAADERHCVNSISLSFREE